MSRSQLLLVLSLAAASAPVSAAGPLVPRERFARAHVQLMVRAAQRRGSARVEDVDVWADGARLKAVIRASGAATVWVDGLSSEPLVLAAGKVAEPRADSLEGSLRLALRASTDLGNSKNDRVAGRPCKVVSESLPGGVQITRCLWRGLPLSVELSGPNGYSFNAAATLVEEGRVAVADLQPPPGAPAASRSLSASQ